MKLGVRLLTELQACTAGHRAVSVCILNTPPLPLPTNQLNHLIPRSTVLLKEASSASEEIPRNLWNREIHFMEPGSSLPHSQNPATCSYLEPDQFSPYLHPTYWRYSITVSSHLRLSLPSGLFPAVFPTKTLYAPLHTPYVLHTQPISFFFIWSYECLVRSTNHKAPCYVVFSTPLLLWHS